MTDSSGTVGKEAERGEAVDEQSSLGAVGRGAGAMGAPCERRGDALGARMKGYEHAFRSTLPQRMPVMLRVDGKAFHTATRGCKQPFDGGLAEAMNETACMLCEGIQGAVFGYVQSDEISVLVHNYRTLNTEAWFANGVQKMVSVAASIATAAFNVMRPEPMPICHFDARAFVLPEAEVANYFIWRQQDAIRNATQMIARSRFSQRELHGKLCAVLEQMIADKGSPIGSYDFSFRRGRSVYRLGGDWFVDRAMPVITEDRAHVERWLRTDEDERRAFGEKASAEMRARRAEKAVQP